jgi:hypothetical protein
MYKLVDSLKDMIVRIEDNAGIPFDPANRDYQQFKRDLANGITLTNAEGTDMTAEQIAAFLKGLV